MNQYYNSAIGLLRLTSFCEGLSLILLLFIAMPIKYLLHNPAWVRIIGTLHGILFVCLVFVCLYAAMVYKRNVLRFSFFVIGGSFIPFGALLVDKYVLKPIQYPEN